MKKVVINIDGGIGRVICSIPAVERFCELHPTAEIMTPWYGVFANNPKIPTLHDSWGDRAKELWFSSIRYSDYRHPEPYQNHLYYTKQHHLIQAFDYALNGEARFERPTIYLTPDEEEFGKKYVEAIKESQNASKVILFQPFGGSAKNRGDSVFDDTYRSLSLPSAMKLMDDLPSDVRVIYRGTLPFSHKKCLLKKDFTLRETLSLVKASDGILSIDSCIQHMAYAFNKGGVILWGATAKENVGYDTFININRPGYPREYVPFRFDFDHSMNQGAMDFTQDELKEISSKIASYLEGANNG